MFLSVSGWPQTYNLLLPSWVRSVTRPTFYLLSHRTNATFFETNVASKTRPPNTRLCRSFRYKNRKYEIRQPVTHTTKQTRLCRSLRHQNRNCEIRPQTHVCVALFKTKLVRSGQQTHVCVAPSKPNSQLQDQAAKHKFVSLSSIQEVQVQDQATNQVCVALYKTRIANEKIWTIDC